MKPLLIVADSYHHAWMGAARAGLPPHDGHLWFFVGPHNVSRRFRGVHIPSVWVITDGWRWHANSLEELKYYLMMTEAVRLSEDQVRQWADQMWKERRGSGPE